MSATRAYQLAYRVLADLFANGVTAKNHALLRRIPELATLFESDGDQDAFAAAHYEALGLGVPPHESVFLDPEGVVGGVVSRTVIDTYSAIGFVHDPTDVAPDHLAVQLEALVFACGHSIEAQRILLDDHVLRWAPSFAFALRSYPIYARAAALLVQVLLHHRDSIDVPVAPRAIPMDEPNVLELDAHHTSLKDIAEYLCLPPASGLWLSRHDLADLGRGHRVPRGFGSRALMLDNLLSSAGDRGVLLDVLDTLLEKVDDWRRMYQALPSGLEPAWLERLDRTTDVLVQMRQAAREVA